MNRDLKIRQLQLEEQELALVSNMALLELDIEYQEERTAIQAAYDHNVELLRAKVEVELKPYPAPVTPPAPAAVENAEKEVA
jgi:hypothetical protein